MSTVQVTLIGKPGCHLCDVARDVVTAVIAEPDLASSVKFEELSLLDSAELTHTYSDQIPVVLINGVVHTIWRVDSGRLARALGEAIQ